MGSWLSSIFTGSNPTLNADISNAGNIMGFGTAAGEGALTAGTGFLEGMLSGNQAEQAQLLAPQIAEIANQANEKTQTNAQFGTRSGGTNASNQNTMDQARASVNNMISQLTGQAAMALPQIGLGELNTGLAANQLQAEESQNKLQNEKGSLWGQGFYDAQQMAEMGTMGGF